MGRVQSCKPKMVPRCWHDFYALQPTQELHGGQSAEDQPALAWEDLIS